MWLFDLFVRWWIARHRTSACTTKRSLIGTILLSWYSRSILIRRRGNPWHHRLSYFELNRDGGWAQAWAALPRICSSLLCCIQAAMLLGRSRLTSSAGRCYLRALPGCRCLSSAALSLLELPHISAARTRARTLPLSSAAAASRLHATNQSCKQAR